MIAYNRYLCNSCYSIQHIVKTVKITNCMFCGSNKLFKMENTDAVFQRKTPKAMLRKKKLKEIFKDGI